MCGTLEKGPSGVDRMYCRLADIIMIRLSPHFPFHTKRHDAQYGRFAGTSSMEADLL